MADDRRTEPFADVLRRARQAAQLTQTELAERANLSVRGLSDLERRVNRRPRRETIQTLVDALQLSSTEAAEFRAAARPLLASAIGLPTQSASSHLPAVQIGIPNNLPIQPTPFIGREKVLASALRYLQGTSVRLLALTGPGGVGKIRLALKLPYGEIEDLGPTIALYTLAFRDPDNVQLELTAPYSAQVSGTRRPS
jgi:transcriptional regulator with XRE-family HTH domain